MSRRECTKEISKVENNNKVTDGYSPVKLWFPAGCFPGLLSWKNRTLLRKIVKESNLYSSLENTGRLSFTSITFTMTSAVASSLLEPVS